MGLYDRFELLELRRDDGIQTFHAREIATARPVQVHLLTRKSPENEALLLRLEHLPDAERRRIIDRGETEGVLYVVTDRLAGHPGFREWLTVKSDPAERISALDQQFLELFDTAETADLDALKAGTEIGPASSETRAMPVLAGPGARGNSSNEPAILAGPAAFSSASFSPQASTATFSPGAPAEPEISSEPGRTDIAASGTHRRKKPAANALLGIAFGILAAIVLLAVIIAALAFRPR